MTSWRPTLADHPGSRARAIADAIGADIVAGRLRAGDRLPPQRELAEVLGLSPNTVMRAYTEATRRGHVTGEVGRGTYVRPADPPRARPATLARPVDGPIDLSVGLPFPGDAGRALATTLAAISRTDDPAALLDNASAPDPAGQGIRRGPATAAAAWLGRLGLPAEPQRVVLTNGAQHGLFAALLTLLRPGDTLLCENLTYAPLKAIARHLGVRLEGLAMDGEGLDPDALRAACSAGRSDRPGTGRAPTVLYCTPTLQTPTTATMSEQRRSRIARIAADHDLTIVEDDVFGFLPPDRPRPLAAFAPERTVFVTSVSKSMGPGLRVGFLLAPERLTPALASAVTVSCWMPPPLMAEIVRRWIEDGTAGRLNDDQRAHAARRQGMARELLGGQTFRADPYGPHLWLSLPGHWSARSFTAAAERAGVLVNPAETFATGPAAAPAVRVCLSHEVSDERVARGLAALATLLDAPAGTGPLVV
ncbi:PLP-dependent aminotransferase family protein [Actinoplanes teichomyceticus]|nr:PLP-dependent aminotransferase family protein [Actinoplanes teichomyceticus]GIF15608.1 transcriptional regulator [Actinoplanes teichomyceticus]